MSLIQSAKLNDHDPYRYLKDVLARLRAEQPHRRNAAASLGPSRRRQLIRRRITRSGPRHDDFAARLRCIARLGGRATPPQIPQKCRSVTVKRWCLFWAPSLSPA